MEKENFASKIKKLSSLRDSISVIYGIPLKNFSYVLKNGFNHESFHLDIENKEDDKDVYYLLCKNIERAFINGNEIVIFKVDNANSSNFHFKTTKDCLNVFVNEDSFKKISNFIDNGPFSSNKLFVVFEENNRKYLIECLLYINNKEQTIKVSFDLFKTPIYLGNNKDYISFNETNAYNYNMHKFTLQTSFSIESNTLQMINSRHLINSEIILKLLNPLQALMSALPLKKINNFDNIWGLTLCFSTTDNINDVNLSILINTNFAKYPQINSAHLIAPESIFTLSLNNLNKDDIYQSMIFKSLLMNINNEFGTDFSIENDAELENAIKTIKLINY